MLAISVTIVPTSSETITVRVAKTVWPCGRSIPNVTNSRFSPLARAEPEEEADDRAEHADHERLDHHRPQHLPPRGAERPQRGELAHPLGDRDRERVRDHERADEERDAREREQDVLQEGDEAVEPTSCPSSPASVAATTCCVGGSSGWISEISVRLVDARLGLDADRVELTGLSKSFCAVGRSKIANVAPPIDPTPGSSAMPAIRNSRGRAERLHADRVADVEALPRRRGLVDHDLVGRFGQEPCGERASG